MDPLLDVGGCQDPHKADVEIAARLGAQILLLAHVEDPVKASPHQRIADWHNEHWKILENSTPAK